MPDYRHTQIGTVLLTSLGAAMLLVGALLLTYGSDPLLLAVLALLALIAVLSPSLTVEIRGEALRLWFGPGLIHKQIAVATIRACAVVQNPWWYGWGIRLTPHGWLYNVSGLGAVELTFQNGRRLRIGTDEPDHLCQAIERASAGARA
jgi:hypothetical protein